MAKPITMQQLENANEDAKSLENFAANPIADFVITRLGARYPNLVMIAQMLQNNAGGGGSGLITADGADYGFKYVSAYNQVAAMRVDNKYYPQYKNLYRYLNNDGGINWYFLFLAIYESRGKWFSNEAILECVEKCIRVGLVAPFQVNTQYQQYQKVSINGKIFSVNIGGKSGSDVPDVSNVTNTGTSGTFIYTGSLTLEYLGKPLGKTNDLPAQWQWYLVDIQPNLYLINFPDSNDSYAAMLLACAAMVVDKAWLIKNSGIGGLTYYDVLNHIIDSNCVNQLDNGLTKVFQQDISYDGVTYAVRFTQDNCEAYAGVIGAAKIARELGNESRENQLLKVAAQMKASIMSLWDAQNTRFKTYSTENDWNASDKTYTRFINKDRFAVAPWRFGLLTNAEVMTHGYPVLMKILFDYPNLYKDATGIDWFALTGWFAWVAVATNSNMAGFAVHRRISVREQGQLTIDDLIAGLVVSPWCGVYPLPPKPKETQATILLEDLPEGYIIEIWNREDTVILYMDNNYPIESLYIRLPSPHDKQRITFICRNMVENLTVWARENYDNSNVGISNQFNANSNASTYVESTISFVYVAAANMWFKD